MRSPARTRGACEAGAAALALLLLCGGGAASAAERAKLILVGARVITMDPARPTASAVAIADGRVVYVGDDAGARALAAPGARVIDGQGRLTVLPGLIDAHAHLVGLGLSLRRLDLRGVTSAAAIADKVRAEARRTAPPRGAGQGAPAAQSSQGAQGTQGTKTDWILGRGWDQNLFPDKALPSRRDREALDEAAGKRPVWLRRIDGHAGWASSEALRRAGVSKATAEVPGGRIVRDASGEPTGVLVDNAMDLMDQALPSPGPGDIEEAILAGAAHVTARGLTAVHEMGLGPQEVATYRRLAEAGRLPLHVFGYAADPIPSALAQATSSPQYREQIEGLRQRLGPPDSVYQRGRFQLIGVKLFADGALGSRGAALLADYSDEPKNRGLLVSPPEHLEAMARWALVHGYQIATHAIGDRGNRLVLDAYERAGVRAYPRSRFRVEHAQVLAPEDLPRFAALGVIASVQPTHATSDMAWAGARLGPERLKGAYAWQRLLGSGARICAGSDFPVEEADPLLGLHAAVTRQDVAGQPPGGFVPSQRLSLGEAVRAFTTDAAYAAFDENLAGQILIGRPADLTVLGGALELAGPAPADLPRWPVRLTVVDGKIVYEKK